VLDGVEHLGRAHELAAGEPLSRLDTNFLEPILNPRRECLSIVGECDRLRAAFTRGCCIIACGSVRGSLALVRGCKVQALLEIRQELAPRVTLVAHLISPHFVRVYSASLVGHVVAGRRSSQGLATCIMRGHTQGTLADVSYRWDTL